MKSAATTSFNSLLILGIITLIIGFLVIIDGYFGYNYPLFTSISQSATTPLTTSMILPFCLGAMCVFFMGYSGYDKTDFWFSKIMSLGAFLVAMNPCNSLYITSDKIGLFALSVKWSSVLHHVGALLLFGTFIIWVGFQFTRSNVLQKTSEKTARNNVYLFSAYCSSFGVLLIVLDAFNLTFLNNAIWLGEVMILIPLGISVIVKAGVLLKDKSK